VGDAAAAGISPGRLYVEVVRPGLAGTRAEYRGIAAAVIAELVRSLPAAERRGQGRGAMLACREEGIEAVDGDVALACLDAGGWKVGRLDRVVDGDGLAQLARAGGTELVVVVVSGSDDALRLTPSCTALRHLADPPVIVLCDFSAQPVSLTASSGLGVDAVAGDPEEMLRQAAARAPDGGSRRWGVRLTRSGRTLRLTPTGTLNLPNIDRLADVVRSRAGSFDALVIDLRDLAGQEPGAMTELTALASRVAVAPDAVTIIPAG
jgi:hypothetical protein